MCYIKENITDTIIINDIEYKEVTIRNRTKLISKNGDALNPIHRNQKCTIHYNPDGYPCFGGGVPVHLYVAYGWVDGWFEGAEVNHIDYDRNNYNYKNLEWIEHKDNINWSSKNTDHYSLSKIGENNGRSKFTSDDVLRIRNLYDSGMSIADILKLDHPELIHQKDYKSLHSTYSNICKRRTWKHL